MDNIMNGGYQYNCRYLNKFIIPCNKNNNVNTINPVLVRSREAQEKQDLVKQIVNLEKKTRRLEKRLENILNDELSVIANKCPCKTVQSTNLLVKSKMAMDYMNLCARVSLLFKRVNQMAKITDTTSQINNICISTRYQPGVVRYNLCVNVKIISQRLNLMEKIISELEELDTIEI